MGGEESQGGLRGTYSSILYKNNKKRKGSGEIYSSIKNNKQNIKIILIKLERNVVCYKDFHVSLSPYFLLSLWQNHESRKVEINEIRRKKVQHKQVIPSVWRNSGKCLLLDIFISEGSPQKPNQK